MSQSIQVKTGILPLHLIAVAGTSGTSIWQNEPTTLPLASAW